MASTQSKPNTPPADAPLTEDELKAARERGLPVDDTANPASPAWVRAELTKPAGDIGDPKPNAGDSGTAKPVAKPRRSREDREEDQRELVYLRGESGVIWPHELPLPDALLDQLAAGKIARVNEDGTPFVAEVKPVKAQAAEAKPGPGREPLSVEERNAARARGIDVDRPHNVVEVRALLALAGDVTRPVR